MRLEDATLDGSRLARALTPHVVVHTRERVDSTNDEIRRLAGPSPNRAVLLVAGAQDAGRGRLGRRWHSPAGAGVYLSLLVRPSVPAEHLARWTLGAGVGVCVALGACGVDDVALEWPNDLVARGCKLGGVLAETRTQGQRVTELVIGVGINVMPLGAEADDETRGRATSLSELVRPATVPDREQIALAIAQELLSIVERLERGAWGQIAAEWLALSLDAPGRRVEVAGEFGWSRAVTAGLGSDGALLVRYDDGRDLAVHLAGSVRPLER